MAGEALGLVDAARLLLEAESGVVPVLVAQHLRDVGAPAGLARHRRVEEQFVGDEETVGADHRLAVRVQPGRVDLGEQHRAVRQRRAGLGRLHGRRVGEEVAHLPGGREVDRVISGESVPVPLRELHAAGGQAGQESRFRPGLRAGLRGEPGGDVGDLLGAQLRGDRIHHRVLARAVLQRLQLGGEVTLPLRSKVRDGVADADAVGAVAGRAHRGRLRLACLEVGRQDRCRAGDRDRQAERLLHWMPPPSFVRCAAAATVVQKRRCRRAGGGGCRYAPSRQHLA